MSKPCDRRGASFSNLNATRNAERAAAMKKVHALLEGHELSAQQIAAEMGMNSQTVYGYLRQLNDEGYVCKTGQVDAGGRQTWAQDNAPEKQDEDHAKRAWLVPARQIGMQRHWMDEALFGPAPGVAA